MFVTFIIFIRWSLLKSDHYRDTCAYILDLASRNFTKEISKELIVWRNICLMRVNFSFYHTVKQLDKKMPHWVFWISTTSFFLLLEHHLHTTWFHEIFKKICASWENESMILEQFFMKHFRKKNLVEKNVHGLTVKFPHWY